MTLNGHLKHWDIRKPAGGKFHRNELALIGAPCGIIQKLAAAIDRELRCDYRLGFADADHGASENALHFHTDYTDKINHHQVRFTDEYIEYRFSEYFAATDAVLVNGNHFVGEHQIVLIHPAKKESLQRKLDRLTNVRLIILTEGVDAPWEFLSEELSDLESIPVLKIDDIKGISRFVWEFIAERKPVVRGLVLAGGMSTRMGTDKGAIDYHGKPQREYAADLLAEVCEEVYISARPDMDISSDYDILTDAFTYLGPYGGILSAFRHDPDAAWLVIACDIPLLDKPALQRLVDDRDVSRVATC